MHLIISRTCDDCGGKVLAKLQDTLRPPNEAEIEATRINLGGMHCIRSAVVEIIPGQEVEFEL